MDGKQCRAARAWLGCEARELARAVGCNRDTLRRFEVGDGHRLRPATEAALRAELESRGIVFTFSRDGDPLGIEEARSRICE